MLGIIRKGIENKTEYLLCILLYCTTLVCPNLDGCVKVQFAHPRKGSRGTERGTKLMKGKQLPLRNSIAGFTHFKQKASGKDE